MFGLFKSNPVKALKKEYERKLEAAMKAQRNGDMRTHSDLMTEADELYKRLLQQQQE
ncbi:hypothetical protein C8D92_105161 [Tamilnaduibacter salinus]|uniref:Lacal_2735 family protein n=1 Tax=Tamilnaduibacter salinus TaxID=1484056 RepID=A0A2U1CWP4_9GAMM|nr:DUF6435 family protein [Tamilnaduibacter salinus]PVY76408.1 hypothetical protein C8D92_105161 [Tamilnaduibacter salinus]